MTTTQNNILYIFINHTFCDINEEIKLAQILINEQGSYKVVSKIVDINEVRRIYNDSLKTKNIKIDFSFEGSYLKCDDVPLTKLSDDELNQIKNVVSVNEPMLISIYDLFKTIVECEGYLISEEVLGNDAELLVEGMSLFIPKYSQSSMTCYIPIKVKGYWKTKKLIYVQDGKLVSDEFYFMVKSNYREEISKYNLQEVDNVIYNKESYILYKYGKELTIYAYSEDDLILLPSIINRYCFLSELYKNIINTAEFISKEISINLYGEEPAVNTSNRTGDYNSRYINGYVTFTLEGGKITKKQRDKFIMDIAGTLVPKIYAGKMTSVELQNYVNSLNLNYMERMIYISILNIFLHGGRLPLDRLTYTLSVINNYKIRKFSVDSYLYMLRASLFTFPYKLQYITMQRLKGSDVPYVTIVQRVVKY